MKLMVMLLTLVLIIMARVMLKVLLELIKVVRMEMLIPMLTVNGY